MTVPGARDPDRDPDRDPADELNILFPDLDLEIRDPDTGERVTVTVRELRFLEGLRLAATVRPLIEAIADSVGAGEGGIDDAAIVQALTEHAEAWLACCAQASSRDAAWLARLSDGDGDALSGVMWQANRGFFLRRLIEAVRRRREKAKSPSPTSSMPLCAPATAADTATSPSA